MRKSGWKKRLAIALCAVLAWTGPGMAGTPDDANAAVRAYAEENGGQQSAQTVKQLQIEGLQDADLDALAERVEACFDAGIYQVAFSYADGFTSEESLSGVIAKVQETLRTRRNDRISDTKKPENASTVYSYFLKEGDVEGVCDLQIYEVAKLRTGATRLCANEIMPYWETVRYDAQHPQGVAEKRQMSSTITQVQILDETKTRDLGIYYTVTPKNATVAFSTAQIRDSYVYEGEPVAPTPALLVGQFNYTEITEGLRYGYENNTAVTTREGGTKASVTIYAESVIDSKGVYYTGTVTKTFDITPGILSVYDVPEEVNYTGQAIEPDVFVMNSGGKILHKGTDYTVKCTDNTEIGTATLQVIPVDPNYDMPEAKTFRIVAPPATPTPVAIPTQKPTEVPSPTPVVTEEPTQTVEPTQPPLPSAAASQEPAVTSTIVPTAEPSAVPSAVPSAAPIDPNAGNVVVPGDRDVQGSVFGLLCARVKRVTKNSQTLVWNSLGDRVDGYVIYGNACGIKNKYKKIATLGKTATKYSRKKLKKGTYYKYFVVGYVMRDGKKETVEISKTLHATTSGGKKGNATAVKVSATSLSLKVGQTVTVNAKEQSSRKVNIHRRLRFESENEAVASVQSTKGVITANQAGTCTIYIYAQNGLYRKIKITVE